MTGFLIPALLPLWIAICAWIGHCIGEQLFADSPLRSELKAVIFLVLLPLLLIDELIAKPQFDQLCASRAGMAVHARQTRGRSVYLAELPAEPVAGVLVPVQMHKRLYLDEVTHEPLVSFTVLQAKGGKLARGLGHDGDGPITFEGECGQGSLPNALAPLGLRLVETSQRRDPAPR
jgi:hypothetical protein